jgi:crotonobetainyl-CoA:carnitine CoA-transferase CaiB-like acyl-CoA transferase
VTGPQHPPAEPAAVDSPAGPAAVDLSAGPAAVDPSARPAAVDPSARPAAVDLSAGPAAVDPSAEPAAVDPAAGPLAGVTVVALEQAVAVPFATRQLADLGARVVKVERPAGDFARDFDRTVHGQSSYFVWLNRGKQSVVLDLTEPADFAVLTGLVATADVFVQNLKPGVAERFGLGAASLRAQHPRLITCSVSGYVLCAQLLGDPALAARFPGNPDRVAHDDELTGLIEAVLAGMTADAAAARMDALGIANARLRTAADLADHPQLAARDRWRTVPTPGGPVRMPLPPVTVAGRTPSLGRVPALGADTDTVRG